MFASLPIYVLIFLIALVLGVLFCHTQFTVKHKKLQNDFMAMMIHELRSPLSVIKSSADLILKEANNLSAAQIADMLREIETSSNDLLSLVNNLLDIAKIEAGKIELFFHKANLSDLIKSEVHTYETLAKEKNLELKCNLDSAIPELNCDPEKLKHVLNNLISNSLKFTDSGYIEIATERAKNFVKVCVADTGIGVPNELKPHLFSKYRQLHDGGGRNQDGTGLGLVIVKGIIDAHKGRIWVEDNSPQGTRFVFTLPLS